MSDNPADASLLKLTELPSGLARCWVRYALRPWPGGSGQWIDLSSGGLGAAASGSASLSAQLPGEPPDDVVYLPPVANQASAARLALAEQLGAAGTPFVLQLLPGEAETVAGATVVYDLLPSLLAEQLEALSQLPAGGVAIWPLIAGCTDNASQWSEGLARLAAARLASVQAIATDLSPADRRLLTETRGGQDFEALFHGRPPSERDFSVAAHGAGLEPFLGRPLPRAPSWLRANRWLAGLMVMIGELWLRLGRGEAKGQGFFRAARWIDRERHDLTALCREGNLGVVSWLEPEEREILQEIVDSGGARLLTELRSEYLRC